MKYSTIIMVCCSTFIFLTSWSAQIERMDAETQTDLCVTKFKELTELTAQNHEFACAISDLRIDQRQVKDEAVKKEQIFKEELAKREEALKKEFRKIEQALKKQLDEKSEIIKQLVDELDAIDAEDGDDDDTGARRNLQRKYVIKAQEASDENEHQRTELQVNVVDGV